jgi:thiol:disulfide interchange protein DsbD
MLFYGGILIFAAMSGKGTVLDPFNKRMSSNTSTETLQFIYVSNLSELADQLEKSKLENKTVMLDFYADWCVECKQMEKYTFSDLSVQYILSDIKLLKADVTKNNDDDKALLKYFELFGPPAILFFDHESKEIKSHRFIGFAKPKKFINHIRQVKSL